MNERHEFVTDFAEPDFITLDETRCNESIAKAILKVSSPGKKTSRSGFLLHTGLFRLFVKNGEYVYARPGNIVMIESCDHLVKVHLGIDGKSRMAIRQGSLKDFLSQLPKDMFVRIGRFCAINTQRLSGGNCNKQLFEFDYNITIKPKHFISNAIFTSIGI
jgi:DNA-binding LytR/AlgR family response regulator